MGLGNASGGRNARYGFALTLDCRPHSSSPLNSHSRSKGSEIDHCSATLEFPLQTRYSIQTSQYDEYGASFGGSFSRLSNAERIANIIRLDFVALIANDKIFDIWGAAPLLMESAVKTHKTALNFFETQSRAIPDDKACSIAVWTY